MFYPSIFSISFQHVENTFFYPIVFGWVPLKSRGWGHALDRGWDFEHSAAGFAVVDIVDTIDACELLRQLVGGLSHYNPIIYSSVS